jgi:methylenetetrahydrofolate dehydrogenase (NADP+)/methenyltetrahydrofolate cyclohydrolase
MSARLLAGDPVARELKSEAAAIAAVVSAKNGRRPCLAVVAADDEAARMYASKLQRDAAGCQIDVQVFPLEATATSEAARSAIANLGRDGSVDGILLQTPLPAGVELAIAAGAIPVAKDVDGASTASAGAVALGRPEGFYPATAAAVLELVKCCGATVAGSRALVIGRSAVVGKPAAFGLLNMNATVTIAHSKTRDVAAIAREADILVAAVGISCFVKPSWVKPGAVVIDVGIHRIADASLVREWFANDPARLDAFEKKGSVVVGDCDPRVADVAGAFTPVPGGVGPVTSAILLKQAALAAGRAAGIVN